MINLTSRYNNASQVAMVLTKVMSKSSKYSFPPCPPIQCLYDLTKMFVGENGWVAFAKPNLKN